MNILILSAMDKEKGLLSSILENSHTEAIEGIDVVRGKINGHDVCLATCGIGKVNSALKTFQLNRILSPDLVINSGVAGGAGIPVGSVLVADKIAYHDVWCGPGTNYGEADGMPLFLTPSSKVIDVSKKSIDDSNVVYGLICSGDKFISEPEEINFIRSHFPDVKAVDMESASIAHACSMTSTPFCVVRVVSDTPGEGENISQYKNFWSEAPGKTFDVVRQLISNLDN